MIMCDKCKELFTTGDLCVRGRVLDYEAQVVQKYIACSKCGAEYTVIVTDPKLESLIKNGDPDEARRYAQELREKYLPEGNK